MDLFIYFSLNYLIIIIIIIIYKITLFSFETIIKNKRE